MARFRRRNGKHRKKTFNLQNGFCYYCGGKTLFGKWTIDHKNPISRLGNGTKENKVGCCYNCNKDKGNMTELEFLQTNYLTPQRRAMLGMMMIPLVTYKVAKHKHEERLSKMIKESLSERLSKWIKGLWQEINKLSW